MAARALPAGGGLAVHDSFAGLRLDVDPQELGFQGALDLSNVELGRDGSLRARRGFQRWTAGATGLPSNVTWIWSAAPEPSAQVVVVYGNTVRLLDAAGTTLATQATITPVTGAVRFTDNTHGSTIFACTPASVWRYDAGSWVVQAGAPSAQLLEKTPWDNRLVAVWAGITTADRISFSAPGDAATWIDFVEPAPNIGGSGYSAAVRWREMLFIFKTSLFHVFTGTSTDSTGGAVFDYRTVDFGVGAAGVHGACAAPEGVYFLDATGLYLTAGGQPRLVSDAVRPLFSSNTPPPEYTGPTVLAGLGSATTGVISMTYAGGVLYLAITDRSSGASLTSRLLAYDTVTSTWAVYSLGAVAVAAPADADEGTRDGAGISAQKIGLLIGGPTGDTTAVWRQIPSGTTFARGQDYSVGGGALANFNWSYRTGYNNLGAAGDKTIRRAMIDGTGTITRKLFDERNTPLTYADETVALGATRTEKWLVKSARARAFSVQLSGAGDFSVNRLEHHLGRLRQPLLDSR